MTHLIESGNAEHCRRVLKLHTDDYNREMIRVRTNKEESSIRNERDLEAKYASDLASDIADELKNRQGESARRQQELRDALFAEQERWASSRPSQKAAARRRCLSGGPGGVGSGKNGRAVRDVPPGWAGPPPPSVVVKRAMVGRGEFQCGKGEDPATGAVPLRQNPTHEERRRRKLEYKMLLDEQSAALAVKSQVPDMLPNAVADAEEPARPESRSASRCQSPLGYSSGFHPRGRRSQSARGTPEPTSLNYTYHKWEVAEASRIRHLQRWMGRN